MLIATEFIFGTLWQICSRVKLIIALLRFCFKNYARKRGTFSDQHLLHYECSTSNVDSEIVEESLDLGSSDLGLILDGFYCCVSSSSNIVQSRRW